MFEQSRFSHGAKKCVRRRFCQLWKFLTKMIDAVLKSLGHLVQEPALKNIPEPTSWHLEHRSKDLRLWGICTHILIFSTFVTLPFHKWRGCHCTPWGRHTRTWRRAWWGWRWERGWADPRTIRTGTPWWAPASTWGMRIIMRCQVLCHLSSAPLLSPGPRVLEGWRAW